MTTSRIISADSHMMEPPDLWTTRLDENFRERAPRVVKRGEGKTGEVFVGPGLRPFPVAGGFAAGRSGEELKDFMERARGYEDARPSGWDPVERLKDQDIDGVSAEVLYTTLGMSLFGMEDPELQDACFRTYNGWLAEFCAHDPKRLHGIALISLKDIARGTAELERAAQLGLKGAMIWGAPSPPNRTGIGCTISSGRRPRSYRCPCRCIWELRVPSRLAPRTRKRRGGSTSPSPAAT